VQAATIMTGACGRTSPTLHERHLGRSPLGSVHETRSVNGRWRGHRDGADIWSRPSLAPGVSTAWGVAEAVEQS
jgi:hypothetical protein